MAQFKQNKKTMSLAVNYCTYFFQDTVVPLFMMSGIIMIESKTFLVLLISLVMSSITLRSDHSARWGNMHIHYLCRTFILMLDYDRSGK